MAQDLQVRASATLTAFDTIWPGCLPTIANQVGHHEHAAFKQSRSCLTGAKSPHPIAKTDRSLRYRWFWDFTAAAIRRSIGIIASVEAARRGKISDISRCRCDLRFPSRSRPRDSYLTPNRPAVTFSSLLVIATPGATGSRRHPEFTRVYVEFECQLSELRWSTTGNVR